MFALAGKERRMHSVSFMEYISILRICFPRKMNISSSKLQIPTWKSSAVLFFSDFCWEIWEKPLKKKVCSFLLDSVTYSTYQLLPFVSKNLG